MESQRDCSINRRKQFCDMINVKREGGKRKESPNNYNKNIFFSYFNVARRTGL